MLTADSTKRLLVGRRVADVYRGPRRERDASAGASGSTITTLTAGSANVKGSYAQLTASAGIDADGFFIIADPGTVSNRNFRVDVAIGGAGSEVVILPDLLVTYRANGLIEAFEVYVPIPIKRGTRVAARCQSNGGSSTMALGIELVSGPMYRAMSMKRATAYGVPGAGSGGTPVDPGAVADTKGAWSEISAAITNPIRYAIVCFGNQLQTLRGSASFATDIGRGGAGSEVVVLNNLPNCVEGSRDGFVPAFHPRWVAIPRGVRLAARAASTETIDGRRDFDVLVIGFD